MTKLSLETGCADRTVLLPLALFRVWNTPAVFGLTPFEILFRAPPPLNMITDQIEPVCHSDSDLYARLKTLEVVQKEVWMQLTEAYKPRDLQEPHWFQVGDSVYVRRHPVSNLEPCWKGPYLVLLTTPTVIQVDDISA